MRKASSDFGIILLDDKFVGFALGYDYCAEHEWGIKGIKEMCGMPEGTKDTMGIISRSITKSPLLVFKEETKTIKKVKNVHGAILFTGRKYYTQEENEKHIPMDLEGYAEKILGDIDWRKKHPRKGDEDNDPIITAWSDRDFGIAVVGDKEVGYLKELHQAFKNNNVVVAFTSMKNPFAGTSLCLLIKDRVPAEISQQMYDADKEYYDRIDYEEKIGMTKLVGKKGSGYQKLHYFNACSPKWINYSNAEAREKYKKEHNTKYDIIYWINYSDDDNNFGWYSVEEIREWLTGDKKLTEIRKA